MGERTILIVEDDADINALLAKIVAREGFGCVQAYSGTEALLQMERAAFDLVLLDMMLPGMDGPTLMACMRDELASRVPVIVVSAKAGSADKVGMLAAGADDYVTKPFDLDEVAARVEALLRRAGRTQQVASTVLQVADLTLDVESHDVRRGGEEITLTNTEFELLRYLMENVGIVLSKQKILDAVWSYDFGGQVNVVELYISYLRKKIDADRPALIRTVRGAGYIMREPQ